MATTAKSAATYADLEAVPPHLVAEIIYGTLVTHPRPVPRHSYATSSLGEELVGPFQKTKGGGPGGWIILDEPELHLGPHIVVPDMAGWRRERLPLLPETPYLSLPPDWICEVLSPSSTEKYDKGDKRRIYATYDVKHLWYVDPRAKSLEVFQHENKNWLLTHTYFDDDPVSAPPFDAITFQLGLLWPFDPPTDAPPPA
jgi:Uma2 family endonuclease